MKEMILHPKEFTVCMSSIKFVIEDKSQHNRSCHWCSRKLLAIRKIFSNSLKEVVGFQILQEFYLSMRENMLKRVKLFGNLTYE